MPKIIQTHVREHFAVPFKPQDKNTHRTQTLLNSSSQLKHRLNQQSHIFIVALGALIGALIAACIAYHLQINAENLLLLSLIPCAVPYLLRQVYIHTLSQMHTEQMDS